MSLPDLRQVLAMLEGVAIARPAPESHRLQPLRFWPLWPIGALFPFSLVLGWLWPDGGLEIGLLGVVGPILAGSLTFLWWLLVSRATWSEKIGAILGIGLVTLTTFLVSHPSTRQTICFTALPWSTAVFGAAQWLQRRVLFFRRTWWSVLSTLVVFLPCLAVRYEGIRGDFATELAWRWRPSRSEHILEILLKRGVTDENQPPPGEWSAPAHVAWPQFRGPRRDGKVHGLKLDPDWSVHPPREIWRIPVGPGWGSFCLAGDRLFTQEQRGADEFVVAYDISAGKSIWARHTPGMFDEPLGGPGPRATPTWYEGRLYVQGALGNIACVDPVTGREVWSRSLADDSGAHTPQWGFSSSPLGIDGLIVCYAGGAGVVEVDSSTLVTPNSVVAYDAETGQIAWRAPAGMHSYSSPQLLPSDGLHPPTVLILTNAGLTALDLKTGTAIWTHSWPVPGYRVVQPIQVAANSFLLGTTMGAGTRRIEVADGHARELWTSTAIRPYFNDFIEHRGFLYGFDHTRFACVDLATGKLRWKGGRYGSGQALLLADADQLLVVTEDTGELILVAADPSGHRELGRFPVLKSKTWNHPIIVENRVYMRNREEAVCLELKTASAE